MSCDVTVIPCTSQEIHVYNISNAQLKKNKFTKGLFYQTYIGLFFNRKRITNHEDLTEGYNQKEL